MLLRAQKQDKLPLAERLHSTSSRASPHLGRRTPAQWGQKPAQTTTTEKSIQSGRLTLPHLHFAAMPCVNGCAGSAQQRIVLGRKQGDSTTSRDLVAGLSRHQFRPKNLCTRLGLFLWFAALGMYSGQHRQHNPRPRPADQAVGWAPAQAAASPWLKGGTTCHAKGKCNRAHPGVLVVIHDEAQLAARSQDLPAVQSSRNGSESPQPAPARAFTRGAVGSSAISWSPTGGV